MKHMLLKTALATAVIAAPLAVYTANHREAPITALDRAADITDWYSFVSYDDPSKMTMVLSVDPLLEPSNGPNYFPFDPEILYEMKIDNNHDAVEDLTLQFRFQTEQRLPNVFSSMVGGIVGIPPITALDGPGSQGLGTRQSYTVVALKGNQRFELSAGRRLYAVPSNVGPRTMPNYQALYDRASTTWATASRRLPAPPTTRSISTWAPRSTRSTSAPRPAAACCRPLTTPTTPSTSRPTTCRAST